MRLEGAHIVQTVANLDEDNADVIAHGKQQFFEVFCLCRGFVAEDSTTDLGESINDLGYFGAKDICDVFYRIVCVFYHIMQQGCTDAGRAQSHFFASDLCHCDRVHDIWLARQSAHSFVRLAGEIERLGYYIYLLSMS